MKRVHVLITGRVQGVSFRYYTTQTAKKMGLVGWTMNLADGRVEAVAEGDEETLKQFVLWCKQGPSTARVDDTYVRWMEATGEFRTFKTTH